MPLVPRWISARYRNWALFQTGLYALTIFFGFWLVSDDLGIALVFAVVAVVGLTTWWIWAKRWGRYRDRQPWEDEE